jgi:hypothetical protein
MAGPIAVLAALVSGRPDRRAVLGGGIPLLACVGTVLVLREAAQVRAVVPTLDPIAVAGAVLAKTRALVLRHNFRLAGLTSPAWTAAVVAALLAATVWALRDRVGRHAAILAGGIVVGGFALIAGGRLETIGLSHLLWCERYNVLGQAGLALLAAASARAAVSRFGGLRRLPPGLVPLLCLTPLVFGQQRPESREVFRGDRKLNLQSFRLVDATAALAAKYRIEPFQISAIAYVPFTGGFFNGATFYRAGPDVQPLTPETARRFRAAWLDAARELGVDRWAQRCLALEDRPPIPPETVDPGALRLRLLDHHNPVALHGARHLAGHGLVLEARAAKLEFATPGMQRPTLVAFRVASDAPAMGRVQVILLDATGRSHGHLSVQPNAQGPTYVDLRRLPWQPTAPVTRIRIEVAAPPGTVFRVAFLAVAWER